MLYLKLIVAIDWYKYVYSAYNRFSARECIVYIYVFLLAKVL